MCHVEWGLGVDVEDVYEQAGKFFVVHLGGGFVSMCSYVPRYRGYIAAEVVSALARNLTYTSAKCELVENWCDPSEVYVVPERKHVK